MHRMLSTFLFVIAVVSCRQPGEPAPTPVDIITGSVTIPVKEDIVLPPVAFTPDIEALRAPGDTNPVRMVAYGGSFPAGGRNGGLYREGQLTSIPRLIAHQMQLSSFIIPLFDKEEGNGGGYLVYDRSAPLPSWKRVENSTAIVSQNPLVLRPYRGSGPIDNISWPEGPGNNSDSSNVIYPYPWRRDYFSYLYRFYDRAGYHWGEWPVDYLIDSTSKTKPVHLVLHFEDLDYWIGMAAYSKNIRFSDFLHEGYFHPREMLIGYYHSIHRKQVLFNQPDYLDFPYFHLYSAKALKEKGNFSGQVLEDSALLVPNTNVKRAFAGDEEVILQDEDVLSPEEILQRQRTTSILNEHTTGMFATKYDLPLVDMYSLYKQILASSYYTDDGFFIDPSFPDGNFFSDDGIRPTAIGSAVIANETIKVINNHYKTRIPLIDVGALAERL